MKTLYKRWLMLGLSLSIFALTKLKNSLGADIEEELNGTVKGRNAAEQIAKIATVLPIMDGQPVSATTVTLSGTVIRNGSRFALRETAGVLYTLDSTGRAWPFEGEDVRVTGHFDSVTSLLHVEDIRAMAS